jgi:hypothetical protein
VRFAAGGRGLGFEALEATDLDHPAMIEALADFADRLAAKLTEASKPMLVRVVEAIRRQ